MGLAAFALIAKILFKGAKNIFKNTTIEWASTAKATIVSPYHDFKPRTMWATRGGATIENGGYGIFKDVTKKEEKGRDKKGKKVVKTEKPKKATSSEGKSGKDPDIDFVVRFRFSKNKSLYKLDELELPIMEVPTIQFKSVDRHGTAKWVWAGTKNGGTCSGFNLMKDADPEKKPLFNDVTHQWIPVANGKCKGTLPGRKTKIEVEWTTELEGGEYDEVAALLHDIQRYNETAASSDGTQSLNPVPYPSRLASWVGQPSFTPILERPGRVSDSRAYYTPMSTATPCTVLGSWSSCPTSYPANSGWIGS